MDPTIAVAELSATEVFTTGLGVVFFFGGAEVSPEAFLFGLLATTVESEVMMSDTLTTAQETNIII